jgi:hypothetical protein
VRSDLRVVHAQPHVVTETVVLVDCSCGYVCHGMTLDEAMARWELHAEQEHDE